MGSHVSLKTSRTLWNCDRIGKSQSDLPKMNISQDSNEGYIKIDCSKGEGNCSHVNIIEKMIKNVDCHKCVKK